MTQSFRHPTRGVILLAAFVLGGAGCLGRSPVTRSYTLEPVAGSAVRSTTERLAILVGPAKLPRYLDRPQIVTRDGANEVVIDEFNRWAGGLEANLLRALAANLAQRLQTQRVVAQPAETAFPIDYQVVVDFEELVATRGSDLVLRARWVIRDHAGDAVAVETSNLTLTLAGRTIPQTIEAHQKALGGLADAIAARIADLSRQREEHETK